VTGEAIAFYALAAITLLSGVIVVSSPNIVHSAVALVPAFLGVTGIYILLNADFVAGVQVLIYAGAITVLILFVIMLIAGATRTVWTPQPGTLATYTPGAIGQSFLGTNLLAFEGTSVVLLVSLIGAIIIARKED